MSPRFPDMSRNMRLFVVNNETPGTDWSEFMFVELTNPLR